MRTSRFSAEQIVGILKEHEAGAGKAAPDEVRAGFQAANRTTTTTTTTTETRAVDLDGDGLS